MKFLCIDSEILYQTKFSSSEKLILAAIFALDNEKGCYANNEFFAKMVNVTPKSASVMLNNLKQKGYIIVQFLPKKANMRIIHLMPFLKKGILQNRESYPSKSGMGIPENGQRYPQNSGEAIPENKEHINKYKTKDTNFKNKNDFSLKKGKFYSNKF